MCFAKILAILSTATDLGCVPSAHVIAQDCRIAIFEKHAVGQRIYFCVISFQFYEAPTILGLKILKQCSSVCFVSMFMLSVGKLTYFI